MRGEGAGTVSLSVARDVWGEGCGDPSPPRCRPLHLQQRSPLNIRKCTAAAVAHLVVGFPYLRTHTGPSPLWNLVGLNQCAGCTSVLIQYAPPSPSAQAICWLLRCLQLPCWKGTAFISVSVSLHPREARGKRRRRLRKWRRCLGKWRAERGRQHRHAPLRGAAGAAAPAAALAAGRWAELRVWRAELLQKLRRGGPLGRVVAQARQHEVTHILRHRAGPQPRAAISRRAERPLAQGTQPRRRRPARPTRPALRTCGHSSGTRGRRRLPRCGCSPVAISCRAPPAARHGRRQGRQGPGQQGAAAGRRHRGASQRQPAQRGGSLTYP